MEKADQIREMKLMAHLEEYKVLMAEINLRLQAQHTLLNVTVILIAGGFAFLTLQIDAGNISILLFLPLIFLIIVWWYIGYNLMIGQGARYIAGPLASKVNKLLKIPEQSDEEVWRWLSYQYEEYETGARHIYVYNALNLIKYSPWLVPSILSVLAFLSLHNALDKVWETFEIFLLVAGGVLWIGTLFGLVFFLGWKPKTNGAIG